MHQAEERISAVNKNFSFTTDRWIVSKLNWDTGTTGLLGGHIVLVVEGLVRDPVSFHSLQLFVGQYDMNALPLDDEANSIFQYIPEQLRNVKGIVSDIRVYEGNHYTVNDKFNALEKYPSCHSKSAYRTPGQAKRMIDSIKEDKQKTDQAKAKNPWMIEDFIPYQSAGDKRFNAKNEGHNCVTWVESKLQLTGLTEGGRCLDSIKALPEKHVRYCNLI